MPEATPFEQQHEAGKRAPPLLSILIVNHNGIEHLDECLGSIEAQDFRDFEIVMVDNASTDDSVALVGKRFPDVKIVRSTANLGFAGGNNLGIRNCRGDFVFLLNNDTRLQPGALPSLARGIRRNRGIRVFGCFLIDYENPDRVDSAGDTLYTAGVPFSFAGFPVTKFQAPRRVTAVCAGAAVYHRGLLDELGGFDEDFFLLFEDVDLCLRARHFGEDILFLPSVKVLHKGSASFGGKHSNLYLYYYERNLLLVFLKNFPLRSLLRTLPRHIALKIPRLLHAMVRGALATYLRANWDSIRMIPRALEKRRRILEISRLSPGEFDDLLRRHWLREQLAIARQNYDLPL